MEKTVALYNEANISLKIYLFLKRGFDIVSSILGIIFSLPISLIIIICIKLEDGGPIFYLHKRVGKNGKDIYLYKFRSMVTNSQEMLENFTKEQKEEFEKNFKLENDPRVTKVGKVIRKLSIDELPQLLNILKGDMSLIGPRPVMERELYKFGDKASKVLSVKPGLTGWWACNGRSDTTYEERVELESYYVDNMSIILDIKCFFKTILAVLKRNGVK